MANFPQYNLPQMPAYGPMAGFLGGFQDAETARAQELSNLQSLFEANKMGNDARTYDERFATDQALKNAQMEQAKSHARVYDQQADEDNSARYADRIAKAKAMDELEKARKARAVLQGVQGTYDMEGYDPNQSLNALFSGGQIPESIAPILRPDPQTNNYTKDALARAIATLEERDPQIMGQRKVETQQTGATERNQANIASRERIAQWAAANRSELAKLKASKGLDKIEAGYMKYREMARTATDPDEKAAYMDMAQEYKEALESVKSAGAVAGPDAKAEAGMDMMGLMKENATRKKQGLPPLTYREFKQKASPQKPKGTGTKDDPIKL